MLKESDYVVYGAIDEKGEKEKRIYLRGF